MNRWFKDAVAKMLGLTVAPPVRTSVNRRDTNRFRPMLECFEERAVPATVNIVTMSDATEGGSAGSVRISRDSAPATPLTVNYTVSGSATSRRYQVRSPSLRFLCLLM